MKVSLSDTPAERVRKRKVQTLPHNPGRRCGKNKKTVEQLRDKKKNSFLKLKAVLKVLLP